MYLALSYDHRLIDGSTAVTFFVAVKNAIEDSTRIYPLTGSHEVLVVNGRGEIDPHGKTHLSTLRDSYAVS